MGTIIFARIIKMDELTRQAFTDAWNIYKKYYDCNRSDAYWETLIAEENRITGKYEDTTLIRGLLAAVNNDIGRRLKEASGKGDTS